MRRTLAMATAGLLALGIGSVVTPVALSAALPAALPAAHADTSTGSYNGLALTPPMGFDDWNAYGCNVSASLIEQTALAMREDGMQAAGYKYVNIDDCWINGRDPTTTDISPSFSSMLHNFTANSALAQYAGPGHWNDPDMLEIGHGHDRRGHDPGPRVGDAAGILEWR